MASRRLTSFISLLVASNLLWNYRCSETEVWYYPLALIKNGRTLELNINWFKVSNLLAVWTCANNFNSLSFIWKIDIIVHFFLGCCCKENLHMYGIMCNSRYIINDHYYYIVLWDKEIPLKTLVFISGLFLANWANYGCSHILI